MRREANQADAEKGKTTSHQGIRGIIGIKKSPDISGGFSLSKNLKSNAERQLRKRGSGTKSPKYSPSPVGGGVGVGAVTGVLTPEKRLF